MKSSEKLRRAAAALPAVTTPADMFKPMWRVEVLGYEAVFSVGPLASMVVQHHKELHVPAWPPALHVHVVQGVTWAVPEVPLLILTGRALLKPGQPLLALWSQTHHLLVLSAEAHWEPQCMSLLVPITLPQCVPLPITYGDATGRDQAPFPLLRILTPHPMVPAAEATSDIPSPDHFILISNRQVQQSPRCLLAPSSPLGSMAGGWRRNHPGIP